MACHKSLVDAYVFGCRQTADCIDGFQCDLAKGVCVDGHAKLVSPSTDAVDVATSVVDVGKTPAPDAGRVDATPDAPSPGDGGSDIPVAPDVPEVSCIPDCLGKSCGSDGCGGSCGSCVVAGTTCSAGSCTCEDTDVGSCTSQNPGCFRLHKRWTGHFGYHMVAATLTTNEGNIATKLLESGTANIAPGSIPAGSKVVAAVLLWSGARQSPDAAVTLQVPSGAAQDVAADDCFYDSDSRVGSASRYFYLCRADITGMVGDTPIGAYALHGVDSVILPGGAVCATKSDCVSALTTATSGAVASCDVQAGASLCSCSGSQCAYGQSTIGHASFAVLVVYEKATLPERDIRFYNGMAAFIAEKKQVDVPCTLTPSSVSSTAQISYYVVEGDNDDAAAYSDQSIVPEADKGKPLDNPGESVSVTWGDAGGLKSPHILESALDPLWDDPFNGSTGAGADVDSFEFPMAANMSSLRIEFSSPHLAAVSEYTGETCLDPISGNQCGKDHSCKCKTYKPDTNDCVTYSCFDVFSNDGIGLAAIVVAFDAAK